MSTAELVPGRRYYLGIQPFGVQVVQYVGPVPYWPKKARVMNPLTRRTAWVDATLLRSLVEEVRHA